MGGAVRKKNKEIKEPISAFKEFTVNKHFARL